MQIGLQEETEQRTVKRDYSLWTIVVRAEIVHRMAGARDSILVEAFSEVVREARLAANKTQEQLAHEALVDRTYVGLLENAKRQPTLSVIFSIASSLGVTPETLIKRTRDRATRIGAQS